MINGTREAGQRLLSSGCRYVYVYSLLPNSGYINNDEKKKLMEPVER